VVTPMLFGKRRSVPADTAAEYVGTDSELDLKIPGPLLFDQRRPVSPGAAAQYVGTDSEIEEKVAKGR
jgi:hypothetical protein